MKTLEITEEEEVGVKYGSIRQKGPYILEFGKTRKKNPLVYT